jgi:iron complex transport system ATP-binding protein
MKLPEVLATVAGHVSYLRASVAADGDDWVACDSLIADTATLTRVVETAMPGFGTEDHAVAASLFAQAYAFRVAGVALAAYALELPVPDVAPAATAVRLDKPRPSAVAYLGPDVHRSDAAALAHELVAGHLGAFVDATHDTFRVGRRLLWGNVAASCAVAFRAIESSGVDRNTVRERAETFMAACPPFEGLGSFDLVRLDERDGWYWTRTSCCLWFRTGSGRLCDDCSLVPAEELLERRIRELAEMAS